ncbi:hypothetical protein [Streptomyces massasporeus]|uniref:hypothetical protein n=1 Tax=Streptomyces massasporeus TaxID=67324 RepID=UPI0037FDFF97
MELKLGGTSSGPLAHLFRDTPSHQRCVRFVVGQEAESACEIAVLKVDDGFDGVG